MSAAVTPPLFQPSLFRQAFAALARVIVRDPDGLRESASLETWEREARAEGFPVVPDADRALLGAAMPLLERQAVKDALGALELAELVEEVGGEEVRAWRIVPDVDCADEDEDEPEEDEREDDDGEEPEGGAERGGEP